MKADCSRWKVILWTRPPSPRECSRSRCCSLVLEQHQSRCQDVPWSNALENKEVEENRLHLWCGNKLIRLALAITPVPQS